MKRKARQPRKESETKEHEKVFMFYLLNLMHLPSQSGAARPVDHTENQLNLVFAPFFEGMRTAKSP
jgi:hypothetical protein